MVKAATAADCFEVFAAFYQLIDGEAKTLLNNELNKYIDSLSRTSPAYRHGPEEVLQSHPHDRGNPVCINPLALNVHCRLSEMSHGIALGGVGTAAPRSAVGLSRIRHHSRRHTVSGCADSLFKIRRSTLIVSCRRPGCLGVADAEESIASTDASVCMVRIYVKHPGRMSGKTDAAIFPLQRRSVWPI